MIPLSLEGSEKKSRSYSCHDCVESNLWLFSLLVLVHTNVSKQYLIRFRPKRRICSYQALLLPLSIFSALLLFSHLLGELFFSCPPQMLESATHRGNADLDPRLRLPGVTMLLQGGIRLAFQLRLQLGFQWRSFARGTSRNRLGLYMTLLAPLPHIALNR